MRTFNFPLVNTFDEGDVLLKDGINGTKTILAADAIPLNSDLIEPGAVNKYYTAEEKAVVTGLSANSATKSELAAAVISGVADSSVTLEKISGAGVFKHNLYERATMNVDDYWVDTTGVISAYASYRSYAKTPVSAETEYSLFRDYYNYGTNYGKLLFLDASNATIGSVDMSTLTSVAVEGFANVGKIFTTPALCAFVCITTRSGTSSVTTFDCRDSFIICAGAEVITATDDIGVIQMFGQKLIDTYARAELAAFGTPVKSTDITNSANNLFSANNIVKGTVTPGGTVNLSEASDNRVAKMTVTAGNEYSFTYKNRTVYNQDSGQMAYLDSESAVINTVVMSTLNINGTGRTFKAPVNCAFVLINIKIVGSTSWDETETFLFIDGVLLQYDEVIKIYNKNITDTYLRNQVKNRWTGKQWWAYGDSITEFNVDRATKNYWGYISDKIGVNVTDRGAGGRGFKRYATGSADNLSRDLLNRVLSVSPDADLVTIFLGTNDWAYGIVPLGTTNDTTEETLCGAIYLALSNLLTIVPTKTIAMFTPLPRIGCYPLNEVANSQGYTLGQLVDAIKIISAKFSMPCLDLYHNSNLYPWVAANNLEYFYAYVDFPLGDGLHPNTAGQEILSSKILAFINSL